MGCRTRELAGFGLDAALVASHSHAGFLVVTFTNRGGAPVALNWARQLNAVGVIHTLMGLTEPLTQGMLHDLRRTGAGFFCADSKLAQLDSAAGRWQELARLMHFGFDVLCSDADIAWLRDPLPYFHAVKQKHPSLDVLLASDRVTLDFTATPLGLRYYVGGPTEQPALNAGDLGESSSYPRWRGKSCPPVVIYGGNTLSNAPSLQ